MEHDAPPPDDRNRPRPRDAAGAAYRPSPEFGAVLCDMDGLLVDSEPLWFEVECEVFARLGAHRAWTHADAQQLIGSAPLVSAARMVAAAGAAEPAADLGEIAGWFLSGMLQRLAQAPTFKPGARELLASLAAAGIPLALVSNSERPLVEAVLRHLPGHTFRATVAGGEAARSKPHPDPYVRAADLLGVEPGACIVLEDSTTGAAAGWAAGAVVVRVPDLVPPGPDEPWYVLTSLDGLDADDLRTLHRQGRRA